MGTGQVKVKVKLEGLPDRWSDPVGTDALHGMGGGAKYVPSRLVRFHALAWTPLP